MIISWNIILKLEEINIVIRKDYRIGKMFLKSDDFQNQINYTTDDEKSWKFDHK